MRKDQCNQKPPDDKKCKDKEQYYSCKPTCNNTCENYGRKGPCPLYCTKGCFCKRGLVLRKDGECVKPEECKKGKFLFKFIYIFEDACDVEATDLFINLLRMDYWIMDVNYEAILFNNH